MSDIRFDGERLAALMKKRGLSDKQLAEKAEVSRTMIYYLRKGQRPNASAEIIGKIADALGTTVDHFLGEEKAGKQNELPDAVRQLVEIVGTLSDTRQEELLRIAATLAQLEREQEQHPLSEQAMTILVQVAEFLREHGGKDELALLEPLLQAQRARRHRLTDTQTNQGVNDHVQNH